MIAIDTPSFISYPGTGTVGPFTIPFPVFEVENVEARIINSLGVIDDLVLGADYTLSAIKPGINNSLTLVVAIPTTSDLEIRFSKRANQPAKLRDLGRFAPEIFEKSLDRLTMNILALDQGIIDNQTSIVTMQGELDALEIKVDAIEIKVDATETRVDAIEMLDLVQDLSLNDHESRIDAIEVIDLAQNLSLNDHESRIDAIEVSDLAQDISLNDHESRIDALESAPPLAIAPIVQSKSANFAAAYDYVYVITTAVSVQLPVPVANKSLTLKASSATPVTILRNGSEKIDFVAANKTMSSQDQAITLVTDGTDWYII